MCKGSSAEVLKDSGRALSFGKCFINEVAFGWLLKKLHVDLGEKGKRKSMPVVRKSGTLQH